MPPDLPAVGGQATLLRIPRDGGIVEAYAPDSLIDPIWASREAVPPIDRPLGVSLDAGLLFVLDTTGGLLAVDLEARGVRPRTTGVTAAAFVPNGTVYAVDEGFLVTRYDIAAPTVYRERLQGRPRFMFGTIGDRLVVATDSGLSLAIFNAESRLHEEAIPPGAMAATYWGDLAAVADGPSIRLYQTSDPFESRTVTLDHPAGPIAFSPSGHHLYAAHAGPGVAVIDRYSGTLLTNLVLPAQPSDIRTDGSGRWMVARVPRADSVWAIDLATTQVVATISSSWGADLPTVAGASALVTRHLGDVVVYELGRDGLPEVGRVPGGGLDWWVVSTWLPRERAQVAALAAESVLVHQDSLLVPDSVAVVIPADDLYLQVSSSQNPDWSRELARQLDGAGYPARVLEPSSVDDGFRVVVGPYPTRSDAEEIGRQLGRPYFILTNPPISRR